MGGDPEIQVQSTILAASSHDIASLRTLLRSGSANVQDADTGFTPLHAAIAACEEDTDPSDQLAANGVIMNGAMNSAAQDPETLEKAIKTVKLLLQNGAIWNDLDNNSETPGCIALRLGLKDIYEIMVDAGVRAEMLLNRLDEYHRLDDGTDDSDDGVDDSGERSHRESGEAEPQGGEQLPDVVQESEGERNGPQSESYLRSSLRFQDSHILDDESNGVMMAWERDIMKRSADLLVTSPGLRVLNVGHGMGIIDNFIQGRNPISHHIIEPHPEVLEKMKANGWYEKPGVMVHQGRWQEVVPTLISQSTMFDAIYFDTFAEDYKALRDFFSDSVIGLLDDGGKWGFFNGMGADRQICYDVYGKIVEMDLFEAGFDIVWETIKVPDMSDEKWNGIRRKYWNLKEYRLPTCTFSS